MDDIRLRDAIIATNIVERVFHHISLCIENDRSTFKLNMFEKGVIKRMIGPQTLKGINDYIMKMYPSDVQNLMDDIEGEVKKRSPTIKKL